MDQALDGPTAAAGGINLGTGRNLNTNDDNMSKLFSSAISRKYYFPLILSIILHLD